MAYDRFIRFKRNPAWSHLCELVRSTFPTAEVKCNKPWIAVHFPEMEEFTGHRAALQEQARNRYIELHQNTSMKNVDVMTRQGDDVTHHRAEYLADRIVERFYGEREKSS